MNDRKLAKQAARYESLIKDARNLLRRGWQLERSLWIARQLYRDLNSKKALKVDKEFIRILRSEVLRSISIQTRTMLDNSQDSIGLPGLIEEISGEVGLISEARWTMAPQLWEVQGNKCPKSFNDIWDGARNVSERRKVLSALTEEIEQVSEEVEEWISQTIAHEVKEHRRSKNPPMEGNITNAAEVCIRVIRRTVQLLADIDPAEVEPNLEWKLSC